jgi:hypothetical protein
VAPDANGIEVRIPGQSLYRLRDGQVCFAADYFDNVAYRSLRGDKHLPDFTLAAGTSARFAPSVGGPAHQLLTRFWELQESRQYSRLADLFTDDAVFSDQVFGVFEGHDGGEGLPGAHGAGDERGEHHLRARRRRR